MSKKKSGLGRGLDALLRDIHLEAPLSATPAFPIAHSADKIDNDLHFLPIEFLARGSYQPRGEISPESLTELTESIKAQGIIQPIVAIKTAENQYEIVAGERRWRAAQLAGLDKVPVILRNFTPQAAMAVALIENIQREDLNPLETALGLRRLIDECGLTHQEIAQAVGKSRSNVSNLLRLLDLNEEVKTYLVEGQLEMGHARALLSLPASQQLKIAQKIVNQNLSVRQAEQLVKKQGNSRHKLAFSPELDPNIIDLQETLSEHLGAVVEIKSNATGKGQLIIKYFSNDELSGILERLLKEAII
jgi:ParB family chromosome partitioning protein